MAFPVRSAAARVRAARAARSAALTGCVALLGAACGGVVADGAADGTDGPRLYVTSGVTDEVLRIDPEDGHVLERIAVDRRRGESDEPHGIEVAPDGAHWYVTLAHGDPTLWKFESAGDRLVGRVSLGMSGAARIGITPDGRRAFVPDYYRAGGGRASQVAVIDLLDLRIVDRRTLCAAPHDAQVDPAGERVAIACSMDDQVVVLDVETLDEVARFHVGDPPGEPGTPRFKPLNLVWSPEGDRLYVSLHAADAVGVFAPDGSPIDTIAVGAGPTQLALSGDGGTLVVVNRNDGTLSLIDARALEPAARIELDRPHPHGVALDPAGTTAFVTFEGDTETRGGVVAVNLEAGAISWRAPAGAYTLGVIHVPPATER